MGIRQTLRGSAGLIVPNRAIKPLFQLCNQMRSHSLSRLPIRNKLSSFWVPTGGITEAAGDTSGHIRLLKAGFLRQSNVGMFHMLPLGLRVQKKIEALLDYHMQSIGGTRLEMSAISSKDLWVKSGRYETMAPEVFQLQDRKGAPYLLGPTHEEEITNMVAKNVKSYKSVPLRLYQITNKYRDELRPRNGLLRGREFIMKDMYTFDSTAPAALATYEAVRQAYVNFFNDLKLPFLQALASTGDMGGHVSHEFHVASSLGEDVVINCDECDYIVNDEMAEAALPEVEATPEVDPGHVRVWRGISKDRKQLVNAYYISASEDGPSPLNLHAIKSVIPDLDSGIENPLPFWTKALSPPETPETETPAPIELVNIIDFRLGTDFCPPPSTLLPSSITPTLPYTTTTTTISPTPISPLNLLRVVEGDTCPTCRAGHLHSTKTLELGHAFYLGTRYSDAMDAKVNLPSKMAPSGKDEQAVPMQMGCFGIGVTRIIGAIAETQSDSRGLRWPAVIAPFEVAVVADHTLTEGVEAVYDGLANRINEHGHRLDVVLDDRNATIPWKLNDADMVGYPILVVLGKQFRTRGLCEIQCRALGVKDIMRVDLAYKFVSRLLKSLYGDEE